MGNKFSLIFLILGPILVAIGNSLYDYDPFIFLVISFTGIFLAVTGSYYKWVKPKNRSKWWLLFPGSLTMFGYIPLIFLKRKPRDISAGLKSLPDMTKEVWQREKDALESSLESPQTMIDKFAEDFMWLEDNRPGLHFCISGLTESFIRTSESGIAAEISTESPAMERIKEGMRAAVMLSLFTLLRVISAAIEERA